MTLLLAWVSLRGPEGVVGSLQSVITITILLFIIGIIIPGYLKLGWLVLCM